MVLAGPSEWDRAWWFREQVGLAPMDLAAMDIQARPHSQLIAAVRNHFDTNATDGQVIDALADAGRNLTKTLSWGRDSGEDFAHLRTERQNVLQALGGLTADTSNLLTVNLRMYVTRAVANVGIDSPYRLLSLTAAQRTKVLALQEQRDRVLYDARQRPSRPAPGRSLHSRNSTQKRRLRPQERVIALESPSPIARHVLVVENPEALSLERVGVVLGRVEPAWPASRGIRLASSSCSLTYALGHLHHGI
ncbi:MAG: hypothetical protein GY842_16220, partial [bacterium]|nr:hypothetical protein [bacterium]